MDSLRTNTKKFVQTEDKKCICQVVAIAEDGGLRLYVAWEWKDMANKGVFGFIKSRELHQTITPEIINRTADYGLDIGYDEEQVVKIFHNLFTK